MEYKWSISGIQAEYSGVQVEYRWSTVQYKWSTAEYALPESRFSPLDSIGSSSSISFALCDYNKDKRLDAIIVNNDTGSIDIVKGYF